MRAKESALALLRLQQDELALGQRVRQRDPGCAATRAHVDNGTLLAPDELEPAERIVEQDATCVCETGDLAERVNADGDHVFVPVEKSPWGHTTAVPANNWHR